MKKVETLHVDFENSNNSNTPLFCPFTGKPIVVEDAYTDPSDNYPESVMMTYASDEMEEPVTIKQEFETVYKQLSEKFQIEDEETLIEALNSLDDSFAYLVISNGQYGNIPGDGGSVTFVLRKDNCLIR